jgi:hypothetical protein
MTHVGAAQARSSSAATVANLAPIAVIERIKLHGNVAQAALEDGGSILRKIATSARLTHCALR